MPVVMKIAEALEAPAAQVPVVTPKFLFKLSTEHVDIIFHDIKHSRHVLHNFDRIVRVHLDKFLELITANS